LGLGEGGRSVANPNVYKKAWSFIDVYSFYSHLQLVTPTFEVIHAAQRLIYVNTS
jgi:hypothetical protein